MDLASGPRQLKDIGNLVEDGIQGCDLALPRRAFDQARLGRKQGSQESLDPVHLGADHTEKPASYSRVGCQVMAYLLGGRGDVVYGGVEFVGDRGKKPETGALNTLNALAVLPEDQRPQGLSVRSLPGGNNTNNRDRGDSSA